MSGCEEELKALADKLTKLESDLNILRSTQSAENERILPSLTQYIDQRFSSLPQPLTDEHLMTKLRSVLDEAPQNIDPGQTDVLELLNGRMAAIEMTTDQRFLRLESQANALQSSLNQTRVNERLQQFENRLNSFESANLNRLEMKILQLNATISTTFQNFENSNVSAQVKALDSRVKENTKNIDGNRATFDSALAKLRSDFKTRMDLVQDELEALATPGGVDVSGSSEYSEPSGGEIEWDRYKANASLG